jgi:hypothetical protein
VVLGVWPRVNIHRFHRHNSRSTSMVKSQHVAELDGWNGGLVTWTWYQLYIGYNLQVEYHNFAWGARQKSPGRSKYILVLIGVALVGMV